MPGIRDVYKLMTEGKTALAIMDKLKLAPSRLKRIMCSKRIWKIGLLDRDIIPATAKMMACATAMAIPLRIKELATRDGKESLKACEALLENLNENYPPQNRGVPRKLFGQ